MGGPVPALVASLVTLAILVAGVSATFKVSQDGEQTLTIPYAQSMTWKYSYDGNFPSGESTPYGDGIDIVQHYDNTEFKIHVFVDIFCDQSTASQCFDIHAVDSQYAPPFDATQFYLYWSETAIAVDPQIGVKQAVTATTKTGDWVRIHFEVNMAELATPGVGIFRVILGFFKPTTGEDILRARLDVAPPPLSNVAIFYRVDESAAYPYHPRALVPNQYSGSITVSTAPATYSFYLPCNTALEFCYLFPGQAGFGLKNVSSGAYLFEPYDPSDQTNVVPGWYRFVFTINNPGTYEIHKVDTAPTNNDHRIATRVLGGNDYGPYSVARTYVSAIPSAASAYTAVADAETITVQPGDYVHLRATCLTGSAATQSACVDDASAPSGTFHASIGFGDDAQFQFNSGDDVINGGLFANEYVLSFHIPDDQPVGGPILINDYALLGDVFQNGVSNLVINVAPSGTCPTSGFAAPSTTDPPSMDVVIDRNAVNLVAVIPDIDGRSVAASAAGRLHHADTMASTCVLAPTLATCMGGASVLVYQTSYAVLKACSEVVDIDVTPGPQDNPAIYTFERLFGTLEVEWSETIAIPRGSSFITEARSVAQEMAFYVQAPKKVSAEIQIDITGTGSRRTNHRLPRNGRGLLSLEEAVDALELTSVAFEIESAAVGSALSVALAVDLNLLVADPYVVTSLAVATVDDAFGVDDETLMIPDGVVPIGSITLTTTEATEDGTSQFWKASLSSLASFPCDVFGNYFFAATFGCAPGAACDLTGVDLSTKRVFSVAVGTGGSCFEVGTAFEAEVSVVVLDPTCSFEPAFVDDRSSVCIRSIVGHAEGATTSRISLVSLKGNPDATDPSAGYEAPLNPSMFDSQVVDIAAFTGGNLEYPELITLDVEVTVDWPNGAKAFFGTAQIAVAPVPEATDDPGASTDAPTTSDTTASPSATDGPSTAAPSAGSVDGNGDPALLEGTAAPTDGGDSSPSSVYMAGGLIIAVVVVAVIIVFVVWQRRQVSQLKRALNDGAAETTSTSSSSSTVATAPMSGRGRMTADDAEVVVVGSDEEEQSGYEYMFIEVDASASGSASAATTASASASASDSSA